VRRGAMTGFRSTPVPAWHSPSRRATGTPHPGRGSGDGPHASWRAGGSGIEPPEPSTRQGRCPCHRPSAMADRGTARLKRSSRRSKQRHGSLARAGQEAAAVTRQPDRGGRWRQAGWPGSICHRKSGMVVTGVSTRSRHPVEPIAPHPARIASGGRSAAHGPVKRGRIVVRRGTMGVPPARWAC
jgi:hypothetical protein